MKKLIILDVNGTLLDRVDMKKNKAHISANHDFTARGKKIFLRPHLDSFLIQAAKNYGIACWTSAKHDNARNILKDIFRHPDVAHIKPIFLWYREECEIRGEGNSEMSIKRLSKVFQEFPQYNESNTIILDDSPHKATENPLNALYLPTYTVCDIYIDPTIDTALLCVVKYIRALHELGESDLRAFIRANPMCAVIDTLSTDPRLKSRMSAKKWEVSFKVANAWLCNNDDTVRYCDGRPPFRAIESE